MNFFEKYILGVYEKDGDIYSIRLLTMFFDFRKFYYDEMEPDFWYTSIEMQEEISRVEAKNKRRKNKIPIPTFIQVPWYKTIHGGYWTNKRSRSGLYILGVLFSIVFLLSYDLYFDWLLK